MDLAKTGSTLVEEAKTAESRNLNQNYLENGRSRMSDMIAEHKARHSFRLNAFDYVNPNHGMDIIPYFSIHEEISYEQVFSNLQEGLNRTFDMIPALSGKMMHCSEQEIGYQKGDLCVTIAPLSIANTVKNRLTYKDLSDIFPSFEVLKDAGFPFTYDHRVWRAVLPVRSAVLKPHLTASLFLKAAVWTKAAPKVYYSERE